MAGLNRARVRACKARTWDPDQQVMVSRVYGYRAETVDGPVERVRGSYRDALLDARAYNRVQRAKSPDAA